jgi:hypothetical protein
VFVMLARALYRGRVLCSFMSGRSALQPSRVLVAAIDAGTEAVKRMPGMSYELPGRTAMQVVR